MVSGGGLGRSQSGFLLNVRQMAGLKRAIAALERAGDTVKDGMGYEFTALEVGEAAEGASGLLSPVGFEAVLDGIFSQFCVGK